jgi:hypothetical protein
LFTMVEHKGPAAMRYPRGNGIGVAIDQPPHCGNRKGRFCDGGESWLLTDRWSILLWLPPTTGQTDWRLW